ncbi:MAG: Mpo1-like protein [Bacteroidota bacterium]
MQNIEWYLAKYGESHQNAINKLIHWFCIPAIMFSLFGLLYAVPFPGGRDLLTNWATAFMAAALIYYFRLSFVMFLSFIVVGGLMVYGNHMIYQIVGQDPGQLAIVSLVIFVIAWIVQFVGHKIEGKKPSFLEDVQFLLVGPMWLLSFIYKKLGIRY